MSMDKEKSTDMKPKKRWLRLLRRRKVKHGAARSCLETRARLGIREGGSCYARGPFPPERATSSSSFSFSSAQISHSESRAVSQEAEEHRGSWAGPGTQVAAAESRAVTPHGPRARGHSAALAAVRLPGHPEQGGGCDPATQPAAGDTAAPAPGHRGSDGSSSPRSRGREPGSCPAQPLLPPPSPSPGPLEALSGQGTGPAVGTVLATSELEEKSWFSLEEDLEVEILQELPQGEDNPEEGCSGEQRPPVRPREAWVEHGNLSSCTATGQVSPLPRRATHSWPEVSTFKTLLGYLPPYPSLSQAEARGQWAIAAERVLLPGMVSEEGDTLEDVQASSSRDESGYVACNYEPRHLEPCKDTGRLERSLQTRDQSAAAAEDRSMEELSEDKWNVFSPHAVWVMPCWWYSIQVDLDSSSEEEADADLLSTSDALAAAALAGADEDKEHLAHATAQAQEVAKTAAESGAVTPHGTRACGPALLHSLQRGSRAILSRVAAVIRAQRW